MITARRRSLLIGVALTGLSATCVTLVEPSVAQATSCITAGTCPTGTNGISGYMGGDDNGDMHGMSMQMWLIPAAAPNASASSMTLLGSGPLDSSDNWAVTMNTTAKQKLTTAASSNDGVANVMLTVQALNGLQGTLFGGMRMALPAGALDDGTYPLGWFALAGGDTGIQIYTNPAGTGGGGGNAAQTAKTGQANTVQPNLTPGPPYVNCSTASRQDTGQAAASVGVTVGEIHSWDATSGYFQYQKESNSDISLGIIGNNNVVSAGGSVHIGSSNVTGEVVQRDGRFGQDFQENYEFRKFHYELTCYRTDRPGNVSSVVLDTVEPTAWLGTHGFTGDVSQYDGPTGFANYPNYHTFLDRGTTDYIGSGRTITYDKAFTVGFQYMGSGATFSASSSTGYTSSIQQKIGKTPSATGTSYVRGAFAPWNATSAPFPGILYVTTS